MRYMKKKVTKTFQPLRLVAVLSINIIIQSDFIIT